MIIVCHHSASLVMPNGDPRNKFFYITLTLMMDLYIICYMYKYNKLFLCTIINFNKLVSELDIETSLPYSREFNAFKYCYRPAVLPAI